MAEAAQLTANNTRMNLVFAFNYGSRRELTEAARLIAIEAAIGALDPKSIDEATLARHLYLPAMPEVDLIIRSSGEHRLSNFLLWQAAYAEFSFPGILWPDFNRQDLLDAVIDYQHRSRRFGGAVDRAGEAHPVPVDSDQIHS
jgi:undecaprenyl diphosphate synthase